MEKLNYTFKDKSLLELALTQSGACQEKNNERLEFIGDRVLGLAVAGLLYELFPSEPEGDLARRHASLVSTETLADMAEKLDVASHLRHGHITGGRIRHMLANATEAIFGAIYLDGGFDVARDIIVGLWRDLAIADITPPKDPKTLLQERVQRDKTGELPKYEYVQHGGKSHNPVFQVTVYALGHSATATGDSKKVASANAAAELLKILAF